MLRNDGVGEGASNGDGDAWSRNLQFFFGDGDSYGDGNSDGFGDGGGDCLGVAPREIVYVTALIIDSDPVTTAYQAATMQTIGEVDD